MSKLSNMLRMVLLIKTSGPIKISELALALEVSNRQIRRYKDELEYSGIFIKSKSGKFGGYYMESDDTSIYNLSSEDEKRIINILVSKNYKNINDSYHLLNSIISDNLLDFIDMSTVDDMTLSKLLKIQSAISLSKKIISTYNYNNEVINYSINPYRVYKKYGIWYLIGYHDTKESIRKLRIEKLIDIEYGDIFTYSELINAQITEIVEEVSSIYSNESRILVTLESKSISEVELSRILECKINIVDGHYEFYTSSLNETVRRLLCFGHHIEVTTPDDLINKMKNEIEKMSKVYKR